jgi:hypothetical protein
MSDAWEEIQAIKSKRNSLREKLQKRKKERQDILNQSGGALTSGSQSSYVNPFPANVPFQQKQILLDKLCFTLSGAYRMDFYCM